MLYRLNINQNAFNPKYIANDNLFDYSHRWNFYMGGAGSGKSRYIAQKLILKAMKFPKSKTLICRRYGSTLLNSVMAEFKKTLHNFKLLDHCLISDYAKIYRMPNGSEFIFLGLDSEEKLLSISDISTIFVEEVFEVPEETLKQLSLRLRGKDAPNEIYAAFNPISKRSYLHKWLEESPDKYFNEGSLYYLKTTWRDNYFLPQDYIDEIKKLRDNNYKKWRIYSEGIWGVNEDALVYPNFYVANFNINKVLQLPRSEVRIGLDYGYSLDPTALCVSVLDNTNKRIFIIDEFYKKGLQYSDIYDELVKHKVANTRNTFYAESADPRANDYLKNRGVHIKPVKKTSVKLGISYLQDYRIYIHPNCNNFIDEIENYTYKLDQRTNEYYDDRFEGNDHLMDALRYSYCDLYSDNRLNLSDGIVSIFKGW